MSKSNIPFKPVTYLVLAIYIALTFAVLAMGNNIIAATVPEDHYFELVGSLSLFVTSFLFLYGFTVARKFLDNSRVSLIKQMVYLALAVMFFFGAGEEISWGQRIFGFETPQTVAQANTQEEFNTHNLAVWQNSGFLDANRLFDLFWFSFAVVIPGVAMLLPAFKRLAGKFIPVVYWMPGLLFLYNYAWAKLAKVIFVGTYNFGRIPLNQAVQEIKESNYAVTFIFVGLLAVLDLTKSRAQGSVDVHRSSIKIEPAFHE